MNCGKPTEQTETHHHNQNKGDNQPDNHQQRCRRCHHTQAHNNHRAVDNETQHKYSPRNPNTQP